MPFELVIPKLGMTMQEGTVAEWLVPDGREVRADQPLFRLTTEKLDHEEVAPVAGRLVQLVPDGATLPTGGRIGWLLAPGEAVPDEGEDGPRPGAADEAAAARPGSTSPAPPSVGAPSAPAASTASTAPAARVAASPVARRTGRLLVYF